MRACVVQARGRLSRIDFLPTKWVLGLKLTISDLAQVPVPAEPSHQTAVELIGRKIMGSHV